MKKKGLYTCISLVMLAVMGLGDCLASSSKKFPEQPIEWIIRWGVGGGSSRYARAFSQHLKNELNTPIAIINIPGASGAVGMIEYMKRAPDGYSVLGIETDYVISTALGIYKPKINDLDFIGRIQMDSSWILTRPDSPFKGFEDVVAEAKRKPGKIKLGGIGLTSSEAITVSKLTQQGIEIKFISYDGGGELHAALFRGDVDVIWEEVSDVLHYVQNKQMRPLVACVGKRINGFPDLPTMMELGFEVDFPFFRGIAVKKGVDPAIREKLSKALASATQTKKWEDYMVENKMNASSSHLSGPEFKTFVETYYNTLKQMIDETGYTVK